MAGFASVCNRSEERRVGKECIYRCDWSSDVCSSDLYQIIERKHRQEAHSSVLILERLKQRTDGRLCLSLQRLQALNRLCSDFCIVVTQLRDELGNVGNCSTSDFIEGFAKHKLNTFRPVVSRVGQRRNSRLCVGSEARQREGGTQPGALVIVFK